MKKVLFITALIVILGVIGIRTQNQTKQLQDISVGNLTVGDASYAVSYGEITPKDKRQDQVERLALFYQWTKESPLYISPRAPTEKLSAAVKNLQKAQEFVLNANGNRESVFPIQFLLEIINLAHVQSIFLETRSIENAELLLTAYQKTTSAYLQDAKILKTIVANAPKEKYERPYVFINIALTPKTVEHDLTLLIENGKAIEKEIAKRENCLTGKGPCERPVYAFVYPRKQPNKQEPPPPLPLKVLFEKDIATDNVKGIYGARTSCIGWGKNLTSPMHFFYLTTQPTRFPIEQQFTVQISKMVNERFYTRLNPENLEEKILIDQGVVWEGQNETNTYMCPDLSYQPMLATIDSVFTQQERLFPKLKRTEIKDKTIETLTKEGLLLEETFFTYPNEDNLNLLSSYYAYTYTVLGNVLKNSTNDKSKQWFTDTEKMRDTSLHLHLAIEGRMENFDLLLNRLNEDFFGLGLKSSFRHFRFDPYYLYGIRSAYSLTYLPFSPLVWKKEEKPLFIDRIIVRNAVGPKQRHISYKQAVQLYALEEIEKWYTDKEKIITSLYLEFKKNKQ